MYIIINLDELCQKNIIDKYLSNFKLQEIQDCHFYQVFFCCKHKNLKEISLNSRMDKVVDTLNIEKYIQIHDEFNLLKKLLFEKDQLITFELISKLENCFYDKSLEEKFNTKEILQSLQNILDDNEMNIFNLKGYLLNENIKIKIES